MTSAPEKKDPHECCGHKKHSCNENKENNEKAKNNMQQMQQSGPPTAEKEIKEKIREPKNIQITDIEWERTKESWQNTKINTCASLQNRKMRAKGCKKRSRR